MAWCLASAVLLAPALAEAGTLTVFYLVRHAEKLAGGGDPSLAPEGVRRARELQSVLQNAPIAAVYAKRFKRTQETAATLASDSNLLLRSSAPGSGASVSAWAA